MMDQSVLEQSAYHAVVSFNTENIERLALDALSGRYDKISVFREGFLDGLLAVGDAFCRSEVSLPQMASVCRAVRGAADTLLGRPLGLFVVCTVEGDIHTNGKDFCALLLKAAGFDVVDLGRDVPVDRMVSAIRDSNADFIATSALMAGTAVQQRYLEEAMRKEGLKGRCLTCVGGVPSSRAWAEEIGADIHSETAAELVRKAADIALARMQ